MRAPVGRKRGLHPRTRRLRAQSPPRQTAGPRARWRNCHRRACLRSRSRTPSRCFEKHRTPLRRWKKPGSGSRRERCGIAPRRSRARPPAPSIVRSSRACLQIIRSSRGRAIRALAAPLPSASRPPKSALIGTAASSTAEPASASNFIAAARRAAQAASREKPARRDVSAQKEIGASGGKLAGRIGKLRALITGATAFAIVVGGFQIVRTY